MLGALTHHITKLEEKVEEQDREISRLKLRDSICDCSPEITSLKNELKENKSQLNDLVDKFEKLDTDQSLPPNDRTQKFEFPKAPQLFQYDNRCSSVDLSPRPLGDAKQALRYTPSEFFSTFSNYQAVDSHQGNASSISQPVLSNQAASPTHSAANSAHGVNSSSTIKPMTVWNCPNDAIKQPPSPRKNQQPAIDSPRGGPAPIMRMETPRGNISLDNIRAIAAENSGLRNQLVMYRKKVEALEKALASRDLSLIDLRSIKEYYIQKEREWEQRQDWLDHKMKLLKQDKRRRGETIGKLVKVIDDLKDSGKLDESKVKEGRAVLTTTLQTKDLQHEERVSRVVDSVEFDRVPKGSVTEGHSCLEMSNDLYGSENCNNSHNYADSFDCCDSSCANCCNCAWVELESYASDKISDYDVQFYLSDEDLESY